MPGEYSITKVTNIQPAESFTCKFIAIDDVIVTAFYHMNGSCHAKTLTTGSIGAQQVIDFRPSILQAEATLKLITKATCTVGIGTELIGKDQISISAGERIAVDRAVEFAFNPNCVVFVTEAFEAKSIKAANGVFSVTGLDDVCNSYFVSKDEVFWYPCDAESHLLGANNFGCDNATQNS